MVDTYIKSVSWCPIHHMHVVILVEHKKTKWLPVFIKPSDADKIKSSLSARKSHIVRIKDEIHKITLAEDRTTPYDATVEIKRGDRILKKKMYYATAIIIAAKLNISICIPEEKMLDVQTDVSHTMVRREDVRKALKQRLDRSGKPKSTIERLKSQLQKAIEREEYEEAEIITKEIEILRDKQSK